MIQHVMPEDDIWMAASLGDLAAVMRYTATHVLPAPNERGDSVLMVACRAGHEDVVAHLVDIGADENGTRSPQIAPHAFEAMENGHLETIRAICENGWGLQNYVVEFSKHGMNLIDAAVFHRQTEITRYLLEQGHEIDMNAVLERDNRFSPTELYDPEETLAIEWAAQAGAADWVQFLCEVGVDLGEHSCDYYYERALLIAARRLTKPQAAPSEIVKPTLSVVQHWRDAKFSFKDFLVLMLGWTLIYFVWQALGALWNWLSAQF